mmetsp:Transcript_60063/g.137254  ORF Transcript_60063/g.137254 Transcript_60063/m.137254 type:complete len:292 (+) Transcript_60063:178-1053(+)
MFRARGPCSASHGRARCPTMSGAITTSRTSRTRITKLECTVSCPEGLPRRLSEQDRERGDADGNTRCRLGARTCPPRGEEGGPLHIADEESVVDGWLRACVRALVHALLASAGDRAEVADWLDRPERSFLDAEVTRSAHQRQYRAACSAKSRGDEQHDSFLPVGWPSAPNVRESVGVHVHFRRPSRSIDAWEGRHLRFVIRRSGARLGAAVIWRDQHQGRRQVVAPAGYGTVLSGAGPRSRIIVAVRLRIAARRKHALSSRNVTVRDVCRAFPSREVDGRVWRTVGADSVC